MAPPKRPVKKEFRNADGEEVVRVRLPKGEEVIGVLEQRLGGSRNEVRCLDGKTRNCRIPGRLKRRLWVRPGDVVLVEPWEFDGDKRGDLVFKYKPPQVAWLRRNGHLDALEDMDEF